MGLRILELSNLVAWISYRQPGCVMLGVRFGDKSRLYAIWRFVSMIIPMLFIAIALSGEIQARLTTVIAGPIWVMFVLWQAMDGLTFELLPPTLLWGILA